MNQTISPSEHRLLQHFSNVSEEIFFAFDVTNHQLLLLTSAFDKTWQLSHEFVKRNLPMLINTVYEDDQMIVTHAYSELLKHEKRVTIEFRIHTPEEREKWIKLTACLFKNEAEDVYTIVGIAKDCTIEKESNDKIYEYLDQKNSLLDVLSHDLAAPLKNIYMCARSLSDKMGDTKDESTMQLLEQIEETSRNGMSLIHSFFNKEFMSMNEIILAKHRTNIAERLREIINVYHRSKYMTKINYWLVTSSDSIYVDLDIIKFMQAIQNLLTNAQKFTPDGGNITLIAEEQDTELLIQVKDDGIGIPADLRPFLFDKYSKAKRTGIRGEPTTGLGLFIIKNIVEWHGGRIWFQPTEPHGSTFCILIPKNAGL